MYIVLIAIMIIKLSIKLHSGGINNFKKVHNKWSYRQQKNYKVVVLKQKLYKIRMLFIPKDCVTVEYITCGEP